MNEIGPALVTGASGFVGSAVAKCLLAAGYPVRGLVRPASPRAHLADWSIEFIEGDIRDREAVARAMAGMRYLFHVAADYRLWARYPDEIVSTNVGGTEVVMSEALRAGVTRIVHTSSVATLELRPDVAVTAEDAPLAEADAIGAYKRSKVASERLVEAMVAGDKLPAVIVNPSAPIGPRDVRPTPTGRIIIEAAAGRMPAFVDTGLNLVHVDDVGAGHVAALQRGRPGERYILGGQDVRLADMLADIARLVGRRPPRVRLPRALVYPVAVAAELAAHLTNREPFVTTVGVKMAKYNMFFTSQKAERELGYRARPYQEALTDAISWFRGAGYLR